MIDCEIITWSKDVVGKTLKNVMGLIYHGKEADYLHPQNL